MEKLVLIDGNSLMNRAFYAMQVFTTKDGTPTNGIFGFVKLLLKIISDKKPEYVAVAFDVHAPTFRHQMYTDYKAGRKPMPDDLALQFPVLKDLLRTMGIKICEMPGYEADDIIGTLSRKFNVHSYIYTGDRDSYQLVNDNTTVCFTRKGVSDILELTNDNFKDEVGLEPLQIIDLKALMGDKSDHIPGVAGVGEKSAYSLLEKYGTVENVYEHLSEISGALNTKLQNGKEDAVFSKKLATIDLNAPIDVALSECVLKMPFAHAVREKFSALEFKSLLSKDIFEAQVSVEPQNTTEELDDETPAEVKEILPETIVEAIEILKNQTTEYISCHWTESAFSFCIGATEYIMPIKMGLLDVGFYEDQLVPLFKVLFCGNSKVIAYNVKELLHRLNDYDIQTSVKFEDVGILKCLSEGLSNADSLDFCLNYFSLPEKYKAYGVSWLWKHYLKSLNADERKLYFEVELPLVNVLFDMEKEGVCVDSGSLKEFSARYGEELSKLTKRIYDLAGEEFNVNSTQQLGKILFEKLKIGTGAKKNKESKSYKTTAEEWEKYADDYEIIRCILRYRKIQKLRSTYVDGFMPLIVKGKVHTTYNQTNTQTGRLSSANPNLQNIPIRTEEGRELRKLFTAREGWTLIDADYSQIELRLLAHFSGCKELVQAYCEGKDIHATTAAQVFNVALENVTSDMRRDAKAVNFGIIYGISAFGLSKDLGISTKRAQEYIDKYFETYSEVKNYMNSNVETAKNDGSITTLLGRRRVLNELKSSVYTIRAFGERAAMNMPLQGSSADIIKVAMLNVYNKLKEGNYKAKLVLQVHDELVIDCPEEEKDEVAKLLKTEMENAVSLAVPLTVEIGIGKSWYETK